MKRRFEYFAHCADKIQLEVREMSIQEVRLNDLKGKNIYDVLPKVVAGEYTEELSVYVDSEGNKAVVLPGWVVSSLRSENTISQGLVLYRIPRDKISSHYWKHEAFTKEFLIYKYDQLVWVPLQFVEANGTLNGTRFTEKFGRRYLKECNFSEVEYHEEIDAELSAQISSVNKYGGYYISRYDISEKNSFPQSVKQQKPWNLINFFQAKLVSSLFETTKIVTSHLMFGSEYDTMMSWIGKENMNNNQYISDEAKHQKELTGDYESIKNIYDLNVLAEEWTQEMYRNSEFRVLRSILPCRESGLERMAVHARIGSKTTGFRIAICIK